MFKRQCYYSRFPRLLPPVPRHGEAHHVICYVVEASFDSILETYQLSARWSQSRWFFEGWGYSSVAEHMFSVYRHWLTIPSTLPTHTQKRDSSLSLSFPICKVGSVVVFRRYWWDPDGAAESFGMCCLDDISVGYLYTPTMASVESLDGSLFSGLC